MKFVMAVLLALSLTGSVCAAPYATGQLTRSDYSLPADGGNLYLTVVGCENDVNFIKTALVQQPALADVKPYVHTQGISTESTMYHTRYTQDYRDYPTVRLQTVDGTIVWERAGREIVSASEMAVEIKAECLRRNRRNCPTPRPEPKPEPVTPVQPYVAPTPVPKRDNVSILVAMLAVTGGAALACYKEFSDSQSK